MEIKYIENGSVTSAKGFTANGICAGVKASNTTKKDLALIYCDKVCNSAAIFTKNLVKSDTIYVTKKHLENGTAQAVVVNSGNANACNPDGAPVSDARGKVLLRLRDERLALRFCRLGMSGAARLLLCAGAGEPVPVRGDKAVDELFFHAVGRADDGIAVAVQLQGHRAALGADERIVRHWPI